MTAERRLSRLARLAGIALAYRDAWGKQRRVTPDTLRAILAAMGLAATTPRDIAESIARLEAMEWLHLLPPVVAVWADDAAVAPVTVAEEGVAARASCAVELETGERRARDVALATLPILAERRERRRRLRRLALPIDPDLPPGYHRLTVAVGEASATAMLVVAPRRCYLPPVIDGVGRAWGATAQLYALRSVRNWGMGDFTDLATLGAGVARAGAKTLGINPLHALFPAEPRHISPYSPSSRLFLNPLYLDVEAMPDFVEDAALRQRVATPEIAAMLAGTRGSEYIDHASVAALKRPLFEALYHAFAERHLGPEPDGARSARGAAFRRFQRESGASLQSFAVFTALHEQMLGERGSFCWQDWPAPLRDAASPDVAAFATEQRARIELHQYLQWEADRQLAAAAQRAAEAGLAIGLYRDLAVGVDPNGAQAWADPGMMVPGAAVGAPPDILNMKGQDWGLAPVNPVALKRDAYEPFIAALRANMRHAGMLRIDHVMSLMHLYWVPRGASAAEGTYVSYPFADLRRILALESQRQRCAVIGEDLGTVPSGFREAMSDTGVLSYRLLLFERNRAGRFLPPEVYPALATASFSTHDIATLKGFWLGRDLEWRRDLDLYPSSEAAEKDGRDRRRDRRRLLDALVAAGTLARDAAKRLLPREHAPVYTPELAEAICRFLAAAPSKLALLQLEDAMGELEQVNLPGTIDEHPNWRRKLPLPLERLFDDPLFQRLAAIFDAVRGGAS